MRVREHVRGRGGGRGGGRATHGAGLLVRFAQLATAGETAIVLAVGGAVSVLSYLATAGFIVTGGCDVAGVFDLQLSSQRLVAPLLLVLVLALVGTRVLFGGCMRQTSKNISGAVVICRSLYACGSLQLSRRMCRRSNMAGHTKTSSHSINLGKSAGSLPEREIIIKT